MELIKTIGIALVAGVVAASGVVFLSPKDSNGTPTFGALSGPEISSPYLAWGGVFNWAGHSESLKTSTTTPVAFQSPTNATSTLKLGSGCHFSVSSTTAKRVVFAKATTAFATTTFLFGANIAANAQGSVVATTTTDNFVFAPGTWLVMSMVGGAGVDSPTGSCSACWVSL